MYLLFVWEIFAKITSQHGLVSFVSLNHISSLRLTASSPLKMDGWKMNFLLANGLVSGAFAVSFREPEGYLELWGPPEWTPGEGHIPMDISLFQKKKRTFIKETKTKLIQEPTLPTTTLEPRLTL